jgi:SAM-dependent methyltransferase
MSDQDVPESVRLIGGEMPTWSDLDSPWPVPGPGAVVPVLAEVLAGRSRVLLAGPHAPELVAAVRAVSGELTCLVRSIPDARRLAETFDGDKLQVVCGSLERASSDAYAEEADFDAVVALDDVRRLYSPEGPEPLFGTAVADLRRLLASDGVLVLAVENDLGVHRLTGWSTPETDRSDAAWSPPTGSDATRPRTAGELEGAVWSIYPNLESPTVLWGPAAARVDRTAYAGFLAAAATDAARVLEERPSATDPHLLLGRVWRSGRLADFAAGWLMVAEGKDFDGGDVVAVLPDETVRIGSDGTLHAGDRELPAGRLVSDAMTAAILAPDQAGLRSVVTAYDQWLNRYVAKPVTADRVVLREDGECDPLLPLATASGLTAEEQLVTDVAELVNRAERYGYRRTWPTHLTRPEAVAWVVAMRGRPADPAVVERLVPVTGPVADTPAAREQLERTAEANASRARWFEEKLAAAEKQLTPLRAEISRLKQQPVAAKPKKSRLRRVARRILKRR